MSQRVNLILPHMPCLVMLALWLRNLKTYRSTITGTVSVAMARKCPNLESDFSEMLANERGVAVSYAADILDHGDAAELALSGLWPSVGKGLGEIVLSMEDDCFISDPDELSKAIKAVEDGTCDASGFKRGCANQELTSKTSEIWGTGEAALWPGVLIARKELFVKKTSTLSPKGYKRGDYIPYLDHTCREDGAADTFVEWLWDLRSRGLSINCFDTDNHIHASSGHREQQVTPDCPMSLHIGSLSAGANERIYDLDRGRPLACDPVHAGGPMPPLTRDCLDSEEDEKRCAAWQFALDSSEGLAPEWYRAKFRLGLDYLREQLGIDKAIESYYYNLISERIPLA